MPKLQQLRIQHVTSQRFLRARFFTENKNDIKQTSRAHMSRDGNRRDTV